MSVSDHDKKMVYLAYRDIFKDRLAKLRKPSKVRSVVEKHKDHLHYQQLVDSTDLKNICRILGDLLVAVSKRFLPTLTDMLYEMAPGCIVESNYDPTEPHAKDVEKFGPERARMVKTHLFRVRAEHLYTGILAQGSSFLIVTL